MVNYKNGLTGRMFTDKSFWEHNVSYVCKVLKDMNIMEDSTFINF